MSKSNRRHLTLCIIYRKDQILLGMKKRGFGMGRWNGFGGKVQHDESIEQAALRELQEEAGIIPQHVQARGTLTFHIENEPAVLEVHLFSASEFAGEPSETEEMRPQWFNTKKIPYAEMWPDDMYWLPMVLEGKNIKGTFFFKDTNTLVSHSIQEL